MKKPLPISERAKKVLTLKYNCEDCGNDIKGYEGKEYVPILCRSCWIKRLNKTLFK